MRVLMVLAVCLPLLAADKIEPKEQVPAPSPAVTVEQRAAFWRRNSEFLAAQAKFEEARKALDEVLGQMQVACGGKDKLIVGKDGEPTCSLGTSEIKPKP